MSKIDPPIIGKNVIESLTTGMYDNPCFIYREYIQNAADQIDIAVEEGILADREEGEITVTIDSKKGEITVEDNATGIKSDKIRRFLGDVANSEKDVTKRKGFRGIGRLGGLGYCETLIFETSYKGERTKTTMTLNAKLLKEIIANRTDTSDAATVISIITNIDSSEAPINSHFFRVQLVGVETKEILNVDTVRAYLSMVAPVRFDPEFKFTVEIKKHFRERNFMFDEYETKLNGRSIYKGYKNSLVSSRGETPITSIGFFDVLGDNSQLLATGWYGVSATINIVIEEANVERGIRIRKNNIGIGDSRTLAPRFKSERTNNRYIGEVHTIGDGFIPNARRDYFNDNKTVEEFQKALQLIFSDFESGLPHKASELHNRLKDIKQYRQILGGYRKDAPGFKTQEEQEQRSDDVQDTWVVAENAARRIKKIKAESEKNAQLKDLFDSIVGEYKFELGDDEQIEIVKTEDTYPPLTFSNVNKDQEIILNEIVTFLQKELGVEEAEHLIRKLIQKYN